MKVYELMEDEVLFVYSTTNLSEAIETMMKRRVNGLPVVDSSQKVIGIVTEGDIIARTEMFDRDFDPIELGGIKVTELMTKNPIVINPDAEVGHALAIFAATNIKQIPVVKEGLLIGILSRKDIIKGMIK